GQGAVRHRRHRPSLARRARLPRVPRAIPRGGPRLARVPRARHHALAAVRVRSERRAARADLRRQRRGWPASRHARRPPLRRGRLLLHATRLTAARSFGDRVPPAQDGGSGPAAPSAAQPMFRPFAPWRASCGDGARRRQPTRSRRSVMLKRIVAVAAVLVVAAGSLGPGTAQGGKSGGVAGCEGLPNMVAGMGGFRLGARSGRPDVEVRIVYLQSMEDPAAAKEAAFSLIGAGADVVGGKLNAGHAGLVQAAKEKGVWTIGRSFGHTQIAPERVLTNINEKWSEVYATAVPELIAGRLHGPYIAFGYDTRGTTGGELRYSPEREFNAGVPPAVVAELE